MPQALGKTIRGMTIKVAPQERPLLEHREQHGSWGNGLGGFHRHAAFRLRVVCP